MKFTATVQLDGKTATGINVPDEIVEELGGGKRPAVLATVNGYTYPTTLGVMKGVAKIPLGAQKLFTTWIESAKKPETRERRVGETLGKLRAGETLR
jgi:hypothetical protein